jgi:hypothetical protein
MALIAAAALVRGVSSPASDAGDNNLPDHLPGRLGEPAFGLRPAARVSRMRVSSPGGQTRVTVWEAAITHPLTNICTHASTRPVRHRSRDASIHRPVDRPAQLGRCRRG